MRDIKEMSGLETIKDLPNRFFTLIWKMMSVKGEVLVMAFWLVVTGKVDGWHAVVLFLFSALIVIFGRDSLKWIEALKGLK